MNIAIDIQALQTNNSRSRGIGRYTQSVIEALFRQKNTLNYQLYTNNTIQAPDIDKNYFPYNSVDYPYSGSCDINDLLLKSVFMAADADIIFIPSPMEGLECTIPDYSNFPKKVFVICYDLIPLIFSNRYLNDQNMRSLYMKRLKNIQNADFIFAISESTRQDVIKYLDISPERVLNVSGGVSPFFTPIYAHEQQAWLETLARKFGIYKKFILYTGGEDWRKNIEGLIIAFSKLPKSLQECYQLVVACKVSENFSKEINSLASKLEIKKSIILTNYVTDQELRALYSTCSLFVFPSFYEGFGLPLLEAISCGAPAIASNNSSLPEILGSDELLFDPYSPYDMTRIMQKVLSDESFRKKNSEDALQQSAKFSWESVAKNILDVFQEHEPLNKVSITFNRVTTVNQKPQIAFFSPFPPAKSGIADYTQDLLPYLGQHINLELYHDDSYLPDIKINNNLFSHSKFEERLKSQAHECIIYQIGNSSYHSYMYSQLMRYSGISVLHDYYLGGLINYLEARCPELGVKFYHELEHNYGKDRTLEILQLLKTGELNVHEKLSQAAIYVNRRVFTRSLGVILHSKWAYNCATKDFTNDNACIVHIPQLVPKFTFSKKSIRDERQELGIPNNKFIISTFGFISSTKRPVQILQAFKKYLVEQPSAYLIFVGGTDYLGTINIEDEIIKLSLQGQVKITGYTSMLEFYRYIEVSDICLNLRFPFNGESSASLLRILSVGKPTIVTDIGSFSDFSNDVVLKIPQPGQSDEVEEILKALILLTQNSDYRNSLSQNAYKYIAEEHSPERCANLYSEFIQRVLCSPQAKSKKLADYVGRELAKLAPNISKKVFTNFARAIDNSYKEEEKVEVQKVVENFNLNNTLIPTQPHLQKELNFNDFLHTCRSICLAKIPKAKKILSIGCAGNWYFEWFDKFYPYSIENHTGIDLNPKPLDLPNNVTWIQHDGDDLSLIESQSFDLVFAGQFIEHISWESQVSFLLEVNRVLKPNGIFVLDSPNYNVTNRYGWKQPEHIHELTFEQICELLPISGFEIQDSYGFIPKDLLGIPPSLFGRYIEPCLEINLNEEDIQKAINKKPDNCFVWWLTAQKSKEINRTDSTLYKRMQELYVENQRIKNEVIFHGIGSIVERKQNYYVITNPDEGQGFAIFGPYDSYDKGKYLVEFEIFTPNKKIDKSNLDLVVAIADIAANSGIEVLAKKEVRLRHILNQEKTKLQFSIDISSILEFRVLSLGVSPVLIGIKPRVLQLSSG
ncbi:glycosyltransferase [Nostoc sp. UHCC 0251]|uniref:glycosyltransferase n=1 Tax=Nostoc sp. UHCC 0251 TaxID=3110240 RepID=UPI002B1F6AE9|nr:glycosyltransferase [Nostoc sp. UHCC 0251]MEA5627348.1 glycosyltransferase [Nostoc sp. UHCC 0251]